MFLNRKLVFNILPPPSLGVNGGEGTKELGTRDWGLGVQSISRGETRRRCLFAAQRPVDRDHDDHAAPRSAGDRVDFGRLHLDYPVGRAQRLIPRTAFLLHDLDLNYPVALNGDIDLDGDEKIAETARIDPVGDPGQVDRLDALILVLHVAGHRLETDIENPDHTSDHNHNDGNSYPDLF